MNPNSRAIDIERIVRQAIAQETKIPEDQLRADEPFESYGIESIMSVAIVRRLEESFGDLSKTLLFEYQSLGSLLGYFRDEFSGTVSPPATSVASPPSAKLESTTEPTVAKAP